MRATNRSAGGRRRRPWMALGIAALVVPLVPLPVAGPAFATNAADVACYGTRHTLAGAASPQINVVTFGLFYDCNVHGWQLDITTSDSWAAAALLQIAVSFNTDGNAATGCNGADRSLVGDNRAGLEVVMMVTPTCDPNSYLFAARGALVHPQANRLVAQFTNNDLGNPSSFDWHGVVQGTADPGVQRFPAAGELHEVGFAPVPATNPCPPGTAGVTQAQFAVLGDRRQTEAAATTLRRHGMASVSSGGAGVLRFTGDARVAAEALARDGFRADVSTDRPLRYHDVPNDPGFPTQWNLPVINAPAAWTLTHGSPTIVVADLDTGVDAGHPDLQGQLVPGFDVSTGNPLPAINTDSNGHGTAVAGLIAAATDNAVALAGVGWSTRVMAVKLSDPPTISDIVAGITWATDQGARIINLSLGGCSDPTEAAAVSYAQARGVLIVASAGNDALDGNPVEFPAGYAGVIGVGATAKNGVRASYSETGPQVALVAPGGSADGNPGDDLPVLAPGGSTGTGSGTSFASPQVAAAAALLLATNPTITAADAGAIVVASATRLQSSPDPSYGNGILNLFAAAKAAVATHRVAGVDRYATAAALADVGWPTTTGTVFVASGETFADALGSGAAAALAGSPILLTNRCGLPASTAAELQRLKPTAVYVVGGALAVCDTVVAAIGQLSGVTPIRIAGHDRYATNADLVDRTWTAPVAVAYVTTGANFPDGLTGAPRAARDRAPLLLTDTCALPAEVSAELSRLAPRVVKVIGGVNAVCPGVVDAIVAASGGAQVTRIAGATRVDTGILVAADGWAQAPSAIVASAANFPDALSAGAFAASQALPLLINDSCMADPGVAVELRSLGAAALTVAGGAAALCGAALGPLAAAVSR